VSQRTLTRPPTPARTVQTRRVSFSYPPGDLPRHYVGDDLVMSHVMTNLSAMFPEGEDFFVRSVRNYREQLSDPELKRQVAGFIGQESIHGREHRTFNERLQELGYPTWEIDRAAKAGLKVLARALPKSTQLAITAALEHYTATLAYILLTDREARDSLATEEIRNLFVWHALEESEHKAVAFDVYQEVSGNHLRRTMVMHAVTVGFLVAIVLSTTRSMLSDRAAYNPVRVGRSLARLRRSPFVNRAVVRHLREYNRKGFHPDDLDTSALTESWRSELFGTEGTLNDKLQRAGAAS
jgi:predicted metal-dependent hydrolase